MFDLEGVTIEMACPACSYVTDIALLDVRTQSSIWCACCRRRILLREPDGSVSVGMKQVQQAIDELQQTMKGLFS